MPRYRLTVEYDGAPFVGWQRQENGPSVQQALEEALFRFCGEQATVVGAGRTDTGVHAEGQVAHFDLCKQVEPRTVRGALNFHLRPAPVSVIDATIAPADFHARFSAAGRAYRYRILNRPAPPALDRGQVWWIPAPLDVDAMSVAAERLVGRHDFTSFRLTACRAETAVRTLDVLSVRRVCSEIEVRARARSFLHNQVRVMVGTLVQVGQGKRTSDDVSNILLLRDRRAAGPTAPPQGLCLVEVWY